jgi:(p)ppGpp synthase/HD superfamily hydrolase
MTNDSLAYINHPIGVALLLAESGIDDIITLQAAILHDTVEDTNTTFQEVILNHPLPLLHLMI